MSERRDLEQLVGLYSDCLTGVVTEGAGVIEFSDGQISKLHLLCDTRPLFKGSN